MTESWESEFAVSYVIGDPGLVLGIYRQERSLFLSSQYPTGEEYMLCGMLGNLSLETGMKRRPSLFYATLVEPNSSSIARCL